ncbi:hypothetical protein IFM89_026922 [Coptis chinensis]|uniref:DNA polymerase epsilon subunit n=1 Tax=Coptis chinensis TaxID=261450 RepID=A0A835HVR6_9MAGN|nr:hypothetical protein IFM89_026922 [Coptis chinensis]
MGVRTKKKVFTKFKLRGYTLKLDALEETLSFLSRYEDEEDMALELLLDEIDKESLKSSILDKDSVHKVISLLLEAAAAVEQIPSSSKSPLRVIDAFLVPKFCFDSIKKSFYEYTGKLPIHGDASAKAGLYRDRYQLLLQRISRDPNFSKPAFDPSLTYSTGSSCEISPIQSLIGHTGRRWIMGSISQLEDGHFYLEDLTAAVEVDLSNAISLKQQQYVVLFVFFYERCVFVFWESNRRMNCPFLHERNEKYGFFDTQYRIHSGFFVENTIIVAEGELLTSGIFQVSTCGFPPLEDRDASLALLVGFDFFGGGFLSAEDTVRLQGLEKNAVNEMFIILSDIWLDNEETMEKLATVLDGYENVEVVPSLFVLMGNFCSRPCNLAFNSYANLRSQFGKLGEMIAAHPKLKAQSRFLFIPGPDDAGPSTALPRCALPKYLTEELRNHLPDAIFSSNPCRIKFYAQEIVLFRQDLLYRMRRSSLIPPSSEKTNDPFEHLVATITHQSHLCPLPLTVQPIIWNYDHCLRLYPTPHTIVLADRSEQKLFKYLGTTCFNTGSFAHDNTFVAYRPCTQEVELCAL